MPRYGGRRGCKSSLEGDTRVSQPWLPSSQIRQSNGIRRRSWKHISTAVSQHKRAIRLNPICCTLIAKTLDTPHKTKQKKRQYEAPLLVRLDGLSCSHLPGVPHSHHVNNLGLRRWSPNLHAPIASRNQVPANRAPPRRLLQGQRTSPLPPRQRQRQ